MTALPPDAMMVYTLWTGIQKPLPRRGSAGEESGWAFQTNTVEIKEKNMSKLAFRAAEEKDTSLILQFIRELADYEKLLHEVVATEELLREWIFEKNKAEVIFALEDGVEVGFALFFPQLLHLPGPGSTWRTCM